MPVAGFFGERFAKIAKVFGLDVRTIDYEWGRALKPADVRAAVEEAPTKGVLVQQSETSTAVLHDIEAVGEIARDAGILLAVDCVSSVGAVPFECDAWGVDVACGGSQKALSATPGLAFVAVSERAWDANRTATCPRFYFDWAAYKASYDLPEPENPWTPAIYVLCFAGLLASYFVEPAKRIEAFSGLGFALVGAAVYWLFLRERASGVA